MVKLRLHYNDVPVNYQYQIARYIVAFRRHRDNIRWDVSVYAEKLENLAAVKVVAMEVVFHEMIYGISHSNKWSQYSLLPNASVCICIQKPADM